MDLIHQMAVERKAQRLFHLHNQSSHQLNTRPWSWKAVGKKRWSILNCSDPHEIHSNHCIVLFKVRGFSKMVMGKKQYLFSGIPYAKPPVGNRRWWSQKQCTGISVLKRKKQIILCFFRFRKPERVAPWEGVLDGTKMPNTCVQVFKRRICFGGR